MRQRLVDPKTANSRLRHQATASNKWRAEAQVVGNCALGIDQAAKTK
jgi:hypothetical protein